MSKGKKRLIGSGLYLCGFIAYVTFMGLLNKCGGNAGLYGLGASISAVVFAVHCIVYIRRFIWVKSGM